MFQTCMNFLPLLNTKYFEKYIWVTKKFVVPIDFHSRQKNILWKSMVSYNCLVTDILQNNLTVHQRIEIHTGLKQHEGK